MCLPLIAILNLCVPNVVAAPAGKQTTNVPSTCAGNLRGVQQTYILAALSSDTATSVTIGVDQPVYLCGVLSSGTPPTSTMDF